MGCFERRTLELHPPPSAQLPVASALRPSPLDLASASLCSHADYNWSHAALDFDSWGRAKTRTRCHLSVFSLDSLQLQTGPEPHAPFDPYTLGKTLLDTTIRSSTTRKARSGPMPANL